MFADADGTVPIANGAAVPSRTEDLAELHGPDSRRAAGDGGGHRSHGQRLPVRREREQRFPQRPEADPGPHGHTEKHRPGHRRVSPPRLAGGAEDDRRSGGRIAGARLRGGDLRRSHAAAACIHDPRPRDRRHALAHLRQHPARNALHRHRDSQRQRRWQGGRGGERRRRTAGDDPSGRERDGPHHRHLSRVRLASRHQDDRRSGRGPAGEHHDPHGVRWDRVETRLCDRRRGSRGGAYADAIRRDPCSGQMHGHRDRRRAHRRRLGGRRRQRPDGVRRCRQDRPS